MKHLIRNGRVIDPSQRIDARLNVLLENGKLAAQFHDLWTLWQSGMPGSQGMIH